MTLNSSARIVMPDAVQKKVIEILAEQAVLEPSDVSMDQTLDDLGIESLALVETIFSIEEAFDIEVPFNANNPGQSEFDIASVSSIVAAVKKLVTEQRG